MSKVPRDFGEWSEATKLHFNKIVKFRKFEKIRKIQKFEKIEKFEKN